MQISSHAFLLLKVKGLEMIMQDCAYFNACGQKFTSRYQVRWSKRSGQISSIREFRYQDADCIS